jgi:hypothetical protein
MPGASAGPVCPYCATNLAAAGPSVSTCPACGAPLDVALKVSPSGWTEMPATRDMARIQCGHSSVQIEGTMVPVADFALAQGDGVYFPHHELLWKEPAVNVTQRSLAGAWKRMLAGLPVRMLDAVGPGRIAFSRDAAGETLAVPLHPGLSVDVREHLFMVATHSVTYDWFQSGIWFQTRSGDETETHYPIGMLMDRFTAPQQPGLRPRQRVPATPRAGRAHPREAIGAALQGLERLGAPALRAPDAGEVQLLQVGRAVHVARAHGAGARRGPVGLRAHARSGWSDRGRRADDRDAVVAASVRAVTGTFERLPETFYLGLSPQ